MQTAHDHVRSLLDEIRSICNAVGVQTMALERASDQIETITKAYMDTGGGVDWGVDWGIYRLTKSQRRIAELLYRRMGRYASQDSLMDALFFDDTDNGAHITDPRKLIHVFICKAKQKLAAHGAPFRIENDHGVGYRMMREPASPAVHSALEAVRAN